VQKLYQALTMPGVSQSNNNWSVQNRIGRIPSGSKRPKYGAVLSDGEVAETAFRVIERYRDGLWIEALPTTGRTHQIRVHLAGCGLPILGDELYGAAAGSAPRVMLHALQLTLTHPIE